MKKLAQKIHTLAFGSRCEARPGIKYLGTQDFKGLMKKPFNFKNKNKNVINGYLYTKGDNYTDKVIVLCHGMFGGHEAYMQEINYFASEGYNVLTFDYQGTILSEGDSINALLQGLSDVDTFLTELEKDPNYKNVDFYLFGHSWGAFIASAVIKFHPRVKKVVACSGFVNLPIIFKDMLPLLLSFLKKDLTLIEETKFPEYKGISTIDTFNTFKGEALIIHSKDDKMVKSKTNFEVLKANCANKKVIFKLVENKNHNVTYKEESVLNLSNYLKTLNETKSNEEAIELANKTDFKKLSDLDPIIMNEIIDFYNK